MITQAMRVSGANQGSKVSNQERKSRVRSARLRAESAKAAAMETAYKNFQTEKEAAYERYRKAISECHQMADELR